MKSETIDIWEKIVRDPPEYYREYFSAEAIFLKNQVQSGFTVLDIGSGGGRTMKYIAPFVKNIVGIDNDAQAVAIAVRELQGIENASVLLADAEHTEFSDEQFDLIFTGLTFVNFGQTKTAILAEIRRMLKPDGTFVFSVYNEHALPLRDYVYSQYDTYTVDSRGTVTFNSTGTTSEQFSKEEISIMLKEAGFSVKYVEQGMLYYLIAAVKENN